MYAVEWAGCINETKVEFVFCRGVCPKAVSCMLGILPKLLSMAADAVKDGINDGSCIGRLNGL